MRKEIAVTRFRNGLLSRLTSAQNTLIAPELETYQLDRHRSLETRDRRIEHVYFVESGLVSIVAMSEREAALRSAWSETRG